MDIFQDMKHPILILIRGLPGSGKSYLALELQKRIGSDKVVLLDPDATDYTSEEYTAHTKALSTEGVDEALHAYRFLRGKAYDGIAAHKVIIWNQPFTDLEIFHKMVAKLRLHAEEQHTELPLLVVEVDIAKDIAKQRVTTRKQAGGHGPSDAIFARFMEEYATFAGQGYDVVTVHGQDDVGVSVARVLQALEGVLQRRN